MISVYDEETKRNPSSINDGDRWQYIDNVDVHLLISQIRSQIDVRSAYVFICEGQDWDSLHTPFDTFDRHCNFILELRGARPFPLKTVSRERSRFPIRHYTYTVHSTVPYTVHIPNQ